MYGGFEFVLAGTCYACYRAGIPVLIGPGLSVTNHSGICEPCARIADWHFRAVSDAELAGAPHPTVPGASLVLIVRDRVVDGHPDVTCPRDVLMVERKDEPGMWGLPGGKIEPNESSRDAAVRKLREETTLASWPHGFDLLYTGFSPRGKLVSTFLCRAYGGTSALVEGEMPVEWKPWPPSDHVGAFEGYYRGLEHAFGERLSLAKALMTEAPLCQHMRRSACEYIELMLSSDTKALADRSYVDALLYTMSDEEKLAARLALRETSLARVPEPDASESSEDDDGAGIPEEASDGGPKFDVNEREGPRR